MNKTKKEKKKTRLPQPNTATTAHLSYALLPSCSRRVASPPEPPPFGRAPPSPSLASLRAAAAPASVASFRSSVPQVSPFSLSLCPLTPRRRRCREPCAGAGGGRGAAACGWWSREERGGVYFPSLTHSCCFLARVARIVLAP
jgi:hypothetical protein